MFYNCIKIIHDIAKHFYYINHGRYENPLVLKLRRNCGNYPNVGRELRVTHFSFFYPEVEKL